MNPYSWREKLETLNKWFVRLVHYDLDRLFKLVRDVRVELTFQVWKTHVLTDIRIPRKSGWRDSNPRQTTSCCPQLIPSQPPYQTRPTPWKNWCVETDSNRHCYLTGADLQSAATPPSLPSTLKMVLIENYDISTFRLSSGCSSSELHQVKNGYRDWVRTNIIEVNVTSASPIKLLYI